MEDNASKFPIALSDSVARNNWWSSLSDDWRHTFKETFLRSSADQQVTDKDLNALCSSPAIRIVGPGGSYPNFSGSLKNLHGLLKLTSIEYLFVMHCELESLDGIEDFIQLKSLYVNNNRLTSIAQISRMNALEELYISSNAVTSLSPVGECQKLHTLYCENNLLTSLDGISSAHEKNLKMFKCLPNDQLPHREIIRVQNEYGILCW